MVKKKSKTQQQRNNDSRSSRPQSLKVKLLWKARSEQMFEGSRQMKSVSLKPIDLGRRDSKT